MENIAETGLFRPGHRRSKGRPKGSRNKPKTPVLEAQEAAKVGELTPLDYMLIVMRDVTAEKRRRDDMAKAAAPYVHHRYATIEHTGPDGGPLVVEVVRYADTIAGEWVEAEAAPAQALEFSGDGREASDRDSAPPLGKR